MPSKKLDFNAVRKIALALPEVEESTLHGALSWKVRGRLLACPAIHCSAEPDTLAVRIDSSQRAELIAAEPGVYYVTDHYLKHPMVLVRLTRTDGKSLKNVLNASWRLLRSKSKPKRLRSDSPIGKDGRCATPKGVA